MKSESLAILALIALISTGFQAEAQDDWANIGRYRKANSEMSMCEIAKANGIRPVICSVLPVKQYRWRPEVTDCAEQIIRLNSMLRDYARKNRFRYVDYHSAMKDEENGLPAKWSYDGVHLNIDGYKVAEAIILEALKR